jgi:transcriptional repressor NrdR
VSRIEDELNAAPSTIRNTPGLATSMAKWAALGAVVAIPLPFTMPLGAIAGATYASWKRAKRGWCAARSDSRPSEDGAAIRRRRQCEACGARFTTFERIQLRELTVLKSEANSPEPRREPFERDKLIRSLSVACRKRPIDPARLEQLVSGIQRQLETQGESEVSSARIGELVMEGLKGLDSVAYIRFASVYKDFREARDFEEFAGHVSEVGRG